jgi:hypothetical protein
MARGREGAAKRARERIRKERQDAKRAKRHGGGEDPEPAPPHVDETALLEEFRVLSEGHAAGHMQDADYEQNRHRIFVALGIETEEDG